MKVLLPYFLLFLVAIAIVTCFARSHARGEFLDHSSIVGRMDGGARSG